jgi:hypothetical protein
MVLLALFCCLAGAPAPSVPDAQLQRLLFDPPKPGPSGRSDRRWLGADCATSLALPGRNSTATATLWLFGDTLVSAFGAGHRNLSGCAMPHQTVALQPTPASPLTFSWPEDAATGAPLNLFRPSNASMRGAVPCAAPFDETTPYYWVVSGIAESAGTGLAGPGGRLLLLAQRIVGTPGRGLGFAVLGSTAIVVDNAADAPAQWRHRSADLTTCGADEASCEMWSAGATAVPGGGGGGDGGPDGGDSGCIGGAAGGGCVYLSGGVGSAASGAGQALMRGPLAELLELRFGSLELLGADGVWRRRVPGSSAPAAAGAAGLFPQQSELSLHYHAPLGRWLAASFDGFGGQRLLLWSTPAADVRGPWRAAVAHTLGAPWSNTSRYYAYAAKIHPHLARADDELVLTYVANAWDMDALFAPGGEATAIYTPQVLRTNLTLLLNLTTTTMGRPHH